MAKKGMKVVWGILGTLVILLILLALVDQVATRVFNFDLLLWLAFGNATTVKIYAWIVGIIGGLGLLSIIGGFLAKIFKVVK